MGTPAAGSNVTCAPAWSLAVHWLTDGHARSDRELFVSMSSGGRSGSIVVGVWGAGAAGSNVTTWTRLVIAVHWLVDGHATLARLALTIVVTGHSDPQLHRKSRDPPRAWGSERPARSGRTSP